VAGAVAAVLADKPVQPENLSADDIAGEVITIPKERTGMKEAEGGTNSEPIISGDGSGLE